MCMALAITAARMGANIVNYVEAEQLTKTESNGKTVIDGAVVLNRMTGILLFLNFKLLAIFFKAFD